LVINFKNCLKNLIPFRTKEMATERETFKKSSFKKLKEQELKYLA
jgi:hypothetical protein